MLKQNTSLCIYTHTHTHTYIHTFIIFNMLILHEYKGHLIRWTLPKEKVKEALFTVTPFFKEINSDGSFLVPKDCHSMTFFTDYCPWNIFLTKTGFFIYILIMNIRINLVILLKLLQPGQLLNVGFSSLCHSYLTCTYFINIMNDEDKRNLHLKIDQVVTMSNIAKFTVIKNIIETFAQP